MLWLIFKQCGAVNEEEEEKFSKEFTFDHSYWSYDPKESHFASQEQVFNDLGLDVVLNAFQGYNVCVFAYGQTGKPRGFTRMKS